MFWCVSYYLGAFGTVWLPYETRRKQAELVQKFVPRSRVRIFHNERPQSTPLDPKLLFWFISYYLGALVAVWLPYEQTFVPQSRVGIFRNERTQSTTLDPKVTVYCVLFYLGAFGTVRLPYETRCKTGRTSAKVRATKSRRNFSQRTPPIHPIRPLTVVLVHFVLFGCIRDLLVALRNSVQNGPN